MARSARRFCLLALLFCGWLAAPAHAECGGSTQCIGVGPTEADALLAHHGGIDTFTLNYGNQPVGTTSAAQSVFVAAVTGPAGTTATLGAPTISGAGASDFAVTGGSCAAGGPVHGGASCTITVAFRPATVGAKNATLHVPLDPPCAGCITERVVSLAGTGTAPLPSATNATLSAAASTPTVLELAAFISGDAPLAVRIVAAPAHGTAVLAGTRVTYTPAAGYLGADAFTYDVSNAAGTSAPATVTVSVVPRPDPAADAAVVGLVRAQAQAARRFARAQIANLHARMESLHARPAAATASARGTSAAVAGGLRPVQVAGAAPLQGVFRVAAQGERGEATGTGVWIGGNVLFGSRDQTSDANALRFSSDGVTAGIDRRISERFALGLSVGYARDRTEIGGDGTNNRTRGTSLALYGSYQPGGNTFVDGLLGMGALDLDSERFVAAANDFARGARKGEQWFGSVAAGYEFRDRSLLLSPYGRVDFARARLKSYSESGAGLNALTYFEQRVPTLQLALGLRAESAHETSFGWAQPRLRLEFRHDFKRDGQASLAYADLPAGPLYSIPAASERRNALVLGLGSDFILRGGTRLGIDYQVQRQSGIERGQSIRVWLAQDLDGRRTAPQIVSSRLFTDPVRVEAGITWDDNVNRAREAGEKLTDRLYSLNVGTGWPLSLGEHARLVLSGFVNGDKLGRYSRLDRFGAGGQAEVQYRSSGEFAAPTFGLLGRIVLDDYAGQLRSGQRYAIGLSYRQSLTDRIDLFGALTGNRRNAENAVFDGRDTSLRFNLDYALGAGSAWYLGGEYRRGDAVSSMPASPGYATIAKAETPDDAYGFARLTAYRFEAKTTLWTIGLNWALGPRDAIDVSMRRAQSKAVQSLPAIYGGSNTYTTHQLAAAYLMRF